MTKKALFTLARGIGIALMCLAFFQWVTFDHPDVNPFAFGALLGPGMFGQIINWLVVAVIGAIGWTLFSLEKLGQKEKA